MPVHAAIRKYGYSEFSIEEIATVQDLDELNRLEVFYIAKLGSHVSTGGYNVTWGGQGARLDPQFFADNPRRPASIETRKKMSRARLGKRHTPESLKKMSLSSLGHPVSLETKEKISQAALGRVMSTATRFKIGQAQSGKILSQETRDRISISNKGKNSLNRDKPEKIRTTRTHCRRKHLLDEANSYFRFDGYIACLQCHKESKLRAQRKIS